MALCHLRATVLLLVFAFCDGSSHGHNSGTGKHGGNPDEHGYRVNKNVKKWLEHVAEDTGTTPNVVGFENIENLLERLNFVDCKNEYTTLCNLCFKADDVMNWFKPANGSTYTEEEFYTVLHGILYLIVNNNGKTEENCTIVKQNITSNNASDIFRYFRDKRWGVENKTATESIQAILDDIKFSMGEKLTKKECYNAADVLNRTSIHGGNINETSFESIVVFLIHEISHGKCILPRKSVFIEDTLSHFGNKTHLNQEEFKALFNALNLGTNEVTGNHGDGHEERNHHNHKRRRRSVNHAVLNNDLHTCYSADELLKIYDVSQGEYIDRAKLQEMEAALVQQIESKACTNMVKEKHYIKGGGYKDWQPWIATMLAVLMLTIGSCAGYFATPLQSKTWFPYLMLFMISLAVAVLTGDAMLHLFPHSLGLHGHDEEEHQGHEGESHGLDETLAKESYIWKCVLFLVGGYIFFTFELFMKAFGPEHSHSHSGTSETTTPCIDKSFETGDQILGSECLNAKDVNDFLFSFFLFSGFGRTDEIFFSIFDGLLLSACVTGICGQAREKKNPKSAAQNNYVDLKDLSVISKKAIPLKSFKSVAWMILFGDGLHNFLDGLAIGAAFSAGWPSGKYGGISTSIAIFCHEVPHELGDFAVLLASGLSVNQALVMNYISALTAFLGGIVGCAVGTTSNATPWIFAITGGLFVYLALTNMLPEAINSSLLKKTPWLSIFVIQLGVIIGYVIMFVLGAFEEQIQGTLE